MGRPFRSLIVGVFFTFTATAVAQLGVEFKMKYADWPNMNVGGFVQRIYDER